MINDSLNRNIKDKIDNLTNNSIKIKANLFKDKISDPRSLEIKSVINDQSMEPPVKVKANAFRDKILSFTNDKIDVNQKFTNIKSSENDPSSLEFKMLRTNNSEVKDNSSTSDYVQNNINRVSKQIKTDIQSEKQGIGQVITLSPENLLALSESLGNAEKLQLFTPEGLKKIDIIVGKVIEGNNLSLSDLAQLNKFSNIVLENADKLKVDKSVFQNLNSLINGVQKSSENLENKKAEFNQNAQILNQKLDSLVATLSDPKLKLDSNFVEMLNILRQRYKGIVSSNNPAMITMFSTYLDKVINTVEDIKTGKQNDPLIFRKLHTDYDKFVETLFKSISQNKFPPREELKAYMGELADSFSSMIKDQVRPNNSNFENAQKQALIKMRDSMKFSSNESSALSKVSLISVRKAMSNLIVSNIFSEISSSIKNVQNSSVQIFVAKNQLDKSISDLKSFLISDPFKNTFAQVFKANDFLTKVIADEIEDAIKRANELESKLNLEIDSSTSPNIINLLVKFREIISQLDIDLKKLKEKEDLSKAIDTNFLESVKDNQLRQEKLDNKKEQALKKSVEQAKEKFAIK